MLAEVFHEQINFVLFYHFLLKKEKFKIPQPTIISTVLLWSDN